MQNEHTGQSSNPSGNDSDLKLLEDEVREAIANGTHIKETVHRLTLEAMNAKHVDLESLQRIITAVMDGVQDGATHQLLHASNQAQAAKSQITEAVAGLDSALAGFAEASKLAVQEAASQAKKFSETELKRTRSDLEGLESLFLDTLHRTGTAAQGVISEILLDLSHHAKNNGTTVGSQLKETLDIFAQQIAAVGQSQLETGATLAQKTTEFISKITQGVLSGIKDKSK